MMFLGFVAVILMLLLFFSLLFLLETIIFVCVFKRKAAVDSSDNIKKRLSIYRRQRNFNIIISVVLFLSFILVGVLGVNYG